MQVRQLFTASAIPRSSPPRPRATRRPADLRKLLTHDAERGGTPIKLLSARWLLTHFQKEGNKAARLEHRQLLERKHPEAFIAGWKLERVLAELEERPGKDWYGKEIKAPFTCSRVVMVMLMSM